MKAIIITSIFSPTKAVKKFSQLHDYNVLVIGDKKTPKDWSCPPATFISITEQQQSTSSLAKRLPLNHYCRKMYGYITAIKHGADIIIDTDDDNIPYDEWGFPAFQGNYNCLAENLGNINIYQLYSKQKIWPRGLPLEFINTDFDLKDKIKEATVKIGVWQGLADGDPDVDAIYRLTCNQQCIFLKDVPPIVLRPGTLSPFNSQNTAIIKPLFPLLYLPCYVSFRFTDILRSQIAQPLMWLYGYHLGFTQATVYQDRNPHNYVDDFISEIPMYTQSTQIAAIINQTINANHSLADNLFNIYTALSYESIVPKKELKTLEAWLQECE